jgi:hypothetical protein
MDSQRGNIHESLQPYSAAQYTHEPNPRPEKSATCAYQPDSENPLNRTKTWKERHLLGWRFGVVIFSVAALLVLVANIGIAIYSIRQYGGPVTADFKPVFIGSCDKTKKLNTWTHFMINILSSILLSGSNFSMQVLTAPTRKQIDNAHAKRRWLDIGIPSIRNLRFMGHGQRALWAFILLTSAPLHLV